MLQERLRRGVLRTQRIPGGGGVWRKAAQAVTWGVGRRLVGLPGVEAVYLRHTRPSSGTFMAGESDLDLAIVLRDDAADDPGVVEACAAELERLKRRYLLVKPDDARFLATRELGAASAIAYRPFELLYPPQDWLLIAGREVRADAAEPLPPGRVPWHPEFNRWWQEALQRELFGMRTGWDRGFLRAFHRMAVKSQITLRAARGWTVASTYSQGAHDPSTASRESSELDHSLARLRRRRFWAADPEEVMTRIFWLVLLEVAEFFDNSPIPPIRAVPSHPRSPAPQQSGEMWAAPQDSVPAELEKRIAEQAPLRAALAAAVIAPLPHVHPYVYSVELVLRNGLDYAEFREVVNAVRACFGGRDFTIAEAPAQVALTLERIHRHPLVRLGSPHPFLHEHVAEFGHGLFGNPVPSRAEWSNREDAIDWCRLYVADHRFNLARRPAYASPILNFAQLAGLRIFLETGRVVTDGLSVRTQFRERFAEADPEDRAAQESLLAAGNGRGGPARHARAFAVLAAEYARLEALIARPPAPDRRAPAEQAPGDSSSEVRASAALVAWSGAGRRDD